ncbi:Glucose oxidase [Venustampulla echinocandica]|uniref:Glucose oxidase n=1 Tax=Venustampulla echinocandica TaxID=2656787 RepID=A0A370TYA6_9HELO|nr:Glucose oxidase [Venustampulla echinocandica]RDL40515.1 Glucose oxidase [Venustampulla echinocandica]
MARSSYSTPKVLFGLVVSVVVSSALALPSSLYNSKILSRAEQVKDEYDYIIVGGGTAGLTVADRLTEDGKYSVLVIEYGSFDNSTSVTTIGGGGGGIGNASHLFILNSVPQPNLMNKTTAVIVGKLLGGSSAVNGLQFHRGQEEDYDRWGSPFGPDSDWSWKGILPYFKKALQFTPPNPDTAAALNIDYDETYWGNTSNVHASFPTFNWPMLKTEMAAFGDIPGAKFPPDSGAGKPGVFWYPTSADPATMTRSHSRTGHWDNIDRDNYETITGSKVLKVFFEGESASGVVFVPNNAKSDVDSTTVKARKEVIISAGTIHTPQILQASGVGPKSLLESASISVVADVPGVGQNFQDHPFRIGVTYTSIALDDNFTVHPDRTDLQLNATFKALADAEFAANRSGPLTIASGNAACFLPFPVIAPERFGAIAASYESQDPASYLPVDSHPTIVAGYAAQQASLAKALRSYKSAYYNLFLGGGPSEGALVFLHPVSRGTINIVPSDPFFTEPVVDYRALTNPTDIDIMVEFIRFTRRYFAVPSLAQFQPRETAPGLNVTSDSDLAEVVKNNISPSTFHPVGTAAMAPRELGGVVDEDLLVYGVKKLSVVDASIIPTLPGAYTQETVYALAEKASFKTFL